MIVTVEELDDDLEVIGTGSTITVVDGSGLTQAAADLLYAELVHTHAQADVTDLVAVLAAKADDADITALDGRVDVLEAVNPVLTINGDGPDVDGNVDVAGGGGTVESVNTVAPVAGDITLTPDDFTDGTTNHVFTAADDTKLAGIATGATANDTDANLKARANHTGAQAISTVTGLQTALDGKADDADVTDHTGDASAAHAASAVAFTPTGAVAATDVQAAIAEVDTEKAPLASPALTGNPTAPTQTAGNNSTRLATTAYVDTASGLLVPKSLFDANTMLYATTDDTPAALTVAASRIVGRKASGDIAAMTAAETAAVLGSGTRDATTFLRGDNTWATPSGGGSSRPYLSTPTLHATYGDDFTGASLAAKWSRAGSYVSGDETYQDGGGTYLTVAARAAGSYYYQTPPSGDYDVVLVGSVWGTASTAFMFGIISVDATGKGVGAGFFGSSSDAPIVGNLAGGAFDSSGSAVAPTSVINAGYLLGKQIWYSMRKVGATYSVRTSLDGYVWGPASSFFTPSAFTPARLGFGVFFSGSVPNKFTVDLFDVR